MPDVEDVIARLKAATPAALDLDGPAGLLGGDRRLFHDVGGHGVLAALGVGAFESGGLPVRGYYDGLSDTVDANPFDWGLQVPNERCWRLKAASLVIRDPANARQTITDGAIGVFMGGGQSPQPPDFFGMGSGLGAPAAQNANLYQILELEAAAAAGEPGVYWQGELVLRPGDRICWWGTGTAVGDVAYSFLIFDELPGLLSRPPR